MKQIDVSLWELRYDEVLALIPGTQVLRMDVAFNLYKVITLGTDFISSNMLRYKYFAFDEPNKAVK